MGGVDGDAGAIVLATAVGSLMLLLVSLMMINLSRGAFYESGSHSFYTC